MLSSKDYTFYIVYNLNLIYINSILFFSDKENDENINPQSTTTALKRNAKIFSSQCSNSETEYKNTKKFDFFNINSSIIQDNNTTNKKSIYNNQFGMYNNHLYTSYIYVYHIKYIFLHALKILNKFF